MPNPFDIARALGVLRSAMAVLVLALIAIAPFTGSEAATSGWPFVLNVLAPTFFATMLFVLPLDITMSLVFMSDKSGDERRRFKTIVTTEAVLLGAMFLAWLPLVLRLLSRG